MFFPFPFPFNPVSMASPFAPNAMENPLNPANIFNPAVADMFLKGNAMHKAGIEIDIPNVTPQTKVSELTVPQLVNLLVQVSEQLSAQRAARNPDIAEAIKKFQGVKPIAVNEMIQKFQQAIREKAD